jgi:hypothetical protein
MEHQGHVLEFMQAPLDIPGRAGHARPPQQAHLRDEWHPHRPRQEPAAHLLAQPARQRRTLAPAIERMGQD